MRDVTPEIRQRGGQLVVVGNGTPAQAKAFAEERQLDFPLLTDPGRRTYRAAGLRRGLGSTFNVSLLRNAAASFKRGHRQGATQGDPLQQGGAFVIAPGDEVLFSYVSATAGDHPDPVDLVASLPA